MEAQIPTQFSTCPLFREHPDVFQAFVYTYCEVVELSIQQEVSGTERQVYTKLRTLAREAGRQDGVPQDLIAVHLSALALLVRTRPQAMVRACIRHSRLLLVKLVGELALYYRDQALAAKEQ